MKEFVRLMTMKQKIDAENFATKTQKEGLHVKDKVKLKVVSRRVIKKAMMEEEKSKFEYYSTLYEDLRLHKQGARFYHLLFIVRRTLFILLIIQGSRYSWIQIQFFIIGCIVKLSLLLFSKPLKDKNSHFQEIHNELFLTAIGY